MALLLRDKKIILRALEPEDLEFLYSCENNPEIWHVSNTLTPFSKYILKQYLETSQNDIYTNKQLRLIITKIDDPSAPIGAIDLFDFDPFHMRAGIGILICDEQNRNMGFGSAALNLLITYCFQHLHLHQLYCNISINNSKSIELFKNAGFTICGTKKKWLKTIDGWEDELFLQLLNEI